MIKKVTGYLLLCCFFNVLTTLPAKCCDTGALIHRHSGTTPAHSLTILQHLLDMMDDESSSDTGIDVHCSVFNETRKPVSVQFLQFIGEPGLPSFAHSSVQDRSYASYHTRPFPLPQHHNFLFRLTPF